MDSTIFIDKIGENIERRILDVPKSILYDCSTNKKIRVYVWGISKDMESANYVCNDPILVKSQIQNIRDHYANVKIPPRCKDAKKCYPYAHHIVESFDKLLGTPFLKSTQ